MPRRKPTTPPPLKLVKGTRPAAKKKKEREDAVRVVFIPHGGGYVLCVEEATHYAMKLRAPVAVTIPWEHIGYEPQE